MDLNFQNIYTISTAVTIVSCMVVSLVLILQHNHGERSRIYLAITSFVGSLIFLVQFIYYHYNEWVVNGLLSISYINGGLIFIFMLSIYPIEVLSPGWLNLKRILRLSVPFITLIALTYALIYSGFSFQEINNISELWNNISEFSVWFRLFIVFISILALVLIYLIPYSKVRSNTTHNWIHIQIGSIFIFRSLFFISIFSNLNILILLQQAYFTAFILIVAYHELFVRLFIVPETTQNIRTRINSELKKQPILNADNEQNAEFVNRKQECDKQFERLEKHMTDSETWRNPNLTLPLLAYEVESNRTTLSRCISNAGYETFYDYLAHYRIKCFCELALAGKINNINDTFFEVGFRNRSTAYNQFRKIIGVTPSDYIKKVTRDKKENE